MAVTPTTTVAPAEELTGAPDQRPGGGPWLRAGLMALDTAAAAGGVAIASLMRRPGPDGLVAIGFMLVAYAVWFARARLYRSRLISRRADEVRRIVGAGVRGAVTVALAAYALGLDVDRHWLVLATATTVLLLATMREIVRRRFDARRAAGLMTRRVLMIGGNVESSGFESMFDAEPELGYLVVGRIDPVTIGDPRQLTTEVLATARQKGAHGVVIAATGIDMRSSNRLIRDLVEAGIHVELSSTLADISPDRLTVRPLGHFPVVYVEPRHRHGWRALAKRTFDVTLAGTALVLLSPLFLVVALLTRFSSKGPALFRQERVGRHGEPFELLKFRTMVVGAEQLQPGLATANEGDGPLFKIADDPRVTRVGRWLRRTSLDELPQLWNVLRNDMSLVGPRPALRSEMTEWADDLYARLRVKPGMSGMWQVSGRSATSFEDYTRLDLYYVDNWSLVIDLAILAKTVPAVLRRDGAY